MAAEFVSGQKLSTAIRLVASGVNVRCAVAFWGEGATKELGLGGRRGKRKPRIICDISMGGTNAAELKKLGAPKNSKLLYRDGLHAKVYLSQAGAIIGSANASDRGIGFSAAKAKLIEAGLFVAYDPTPRSLWSHVATWFDGLWNGAEPVDGPALERAEELWNKRQSAALRSGGSTGEARTRTSLLDLVRRNPRLFDEIGFVFASSRLSAAKKSERWERDKGDLSSRSGRTLEQFTDWGKDFERWPEFFFEIWKPKDRISLFWRRKRVALPLDDPDTLYAERLGWREIGPLDDLLLPRPAILEQDEPLIRRIFERSASRLFADGPELAKALVKLR